MDEDIDDDVLSYFTNDIESDGGMDSADELLDMLSTSDCKKNIAGEKQNKKPNHDDDDNGSDEEVDEEVDEDTQAKIAALQAQIKQLKSSKKSPSAVKKSPSAVKKSSSAVKKSPKALRKKEHKNEIPVDTCKKGDKNEMHMDGLCKHGAPVAECFFCSGTSKDTDVAKKVVVKKPVASNSEDTCKHGKSIPQCFFCTGSQLVDTASEPDVTKKAVVSKTAAGKHSDGISKPKMDDLSQKDSTINIYDLLPTIEGKPTSEFSKKRRVAHEVKEDEDSGNFKKKAKVVKEKVVKEKVIKEKVAKEKVVKEKVKECIAVPKKCVEMNTEKGNSHLFGGVEVFKPVMSSTIFDEKTKGRNLIRISKIETKVKGHDIEGDWVTVGVLVKKVTQKQSSTGKNFCVWHLSDLYMGSENEVVALFLFGESYKAHWKIQAGRVLAILNANLMKQDDKYSNQSLAITIDNPKKLMELGDSNQLGGCKGTRKSDGKPCSMYINKKYGEFCEYHVQAAFKKAKSGRMDLQSGGKAPRKGKLLNNLKKDISEGVFYYGGQTITLQEESKSKGVKGNSATKGKSDCSGLKSVMGIQVRIQAAKEYNDMKLKREQEAKLQKDSNTVSSFLRQNRNELLCLTTTDKDSSRNTTEKDSSGKTTEKDSSGKTSVRNMDKIQKSESKPKFVAKQNRKEVKTNDDKTKGDKRVDLCDLKFFQGSKSTENDKKVSPNFKSKLKSAPVLGRGFNKESDLLEFTEDIDDFCYEKHTGEEPLVPNEDTFKIIPPKTNTEDIQEDIPIKKRVFLKERSMQARNKAISILQANGPIRLEDPNIDTAKKKPKSLETIEKMVNICDKSSEEKNEKEKKKKKSMLAGVLGQIDLNSEAGKQLLKKQSKHVGAVKLAEAEKEEKYFDALEKKENMQEKMNNTFEIKVGGIACRECQYLAESQSELCRNSGHAVAKIPNMIKRFFICKSCKTRCCSYNKLIPKKACTRCGERNFEKTAMSMERKGPLIGGETLEVRGREQKFILSSY